MQGSSNKHDLSPGDSQQPSKKLRMETPDFETSGLLGTSFQNSKNYLSTVSPSFNDSSLERTYGSFSNRSSLSRPLGNNDKSASERFGPYSVRPSRKHSTPMIIRAKRQIPEDADPHVTTTAQKIIETLARMSTPVANAQKVPIDSIKPLKPSFTNLRRNIDYGGPPVLRSPLVPSSSKIVSSPVSSNNITLRNLPKLVDSATNTDHISHLETPVTYDDSEKHTGGGKIRRNLSRMHAAPLKKPVVANNFGAHNNVKEKSDFNFGSSWTAEEVIEAMAVRKEERKKNAAEVTNKNMENDSGEDSDGSGPTEKKWNCPSCGVRNEDDIQSCGSCSGKKFGLSVEKTKTVPSISISSVPSTATPTAISLPLTANSKSQWDCPVCMVPNAIDAPCCVCCSEKNPNAKKVDTASTTVASTPTPAFKFGISTTASNSTFSTATTPSSFIFGATSTPAPAAKKPEAAPTSTTGFAVASKKWTCPTCCVPNEMTAKVCVCCCEKNPNSSSETTSSDASTTSAATTSQFTFGFGAPKPLSPTTTSNTTPISTLTGATIPTPNSTPSFSIDKQSPANDSLKPIFGIKTEKLSENVEKEKPNVFASFQFKALPTTPAPTTTPIVTSVSSDTPEMEIMWKCDICPANNKESVTHCIACDAKRPLKVNKDANKKFSFAPFAGGRGIGSPSTSNTLQPGKASIFGGSKPANELPGESPKQKRKHSDDSPDAGFQYTAPEPKLKMKAPSEAVAVQPTEIKIGSFLDAIKPSQSSSLFGGTTSTTPVPTIPISTPVTTAAAPATSTPFVFGNASTSTPAAPFQFGATIPSANTTFSFGSSSTTSKPSAPASVFGASTLPVLPNTSMPQPAPTAVQPLIPPTIPSFNMTPNVNFGVPSVPGLVSANNTAPAPLFTFSANATPSEANTGGGQRKIRKAHRRMNK